MEISKDNIAQWVIDNRYPKSEFEKVSDMEMYHEIVSMIEKLVNQNLPIQNVSHCDAIFDELSEKEKCKECDGKGEYYHETIQSYMTCPYCHGTKTEK